MILPVLFAVIAALFACVGQAGGVGYVALLGIYGFDAADTKMATLCLTLLVSVIGLWRYQRHGLLKTRDWYPFAILGIPLSLIGGAINLPGDAYRWTMTVLLVAAALQMIRTARASEDASAHESVMPFMPSLVLGGVTGLIAGITGVGAGVFLAAALMSLRWASTRRVAAAAQASNLFTSFPALAGAWMATPSLPAQLPLWALAVVIGGFAGAWAGTKHLPVVALRLILALILLASGIKLAFG